MITKEQLINILTDDDFDGFLKFERIKNKLARRRDLHAMILIDKLLEPESKYDTCIVSAAEHDVFYLGVDIDELAKVISEEQAVELAICGVIYEEDVESLAFYA